MRYWWVNQNQTFRQEIAGGYLWSPKRNANGARNPFYESMREVSPGDLVFSFVDTRVAAVGIAKSYCWECPKPIEFWLCGPELGKCRMESERIVYSIAEQDPPQGSHGSIKRSFTGSLFTSPA